MSRKIKLILIDDDNKKALIYVNKMIFKNTNCYFNKLFFGNFQENRLNEIELNVPCADKTLDIIEMYRGSLLPDFDLNDQIKLLECLSYFSMNCDDILEKLKLPTDDDIKMDTLKFLMDLNIPVDKLLDKFKISSKYFPELVEVLSSMKLTNNVVGCISNNLPKNYNIDKLPVQIKQEIKKRLIFTGDRYGNIKLWNWMNGKLMKTLKGHNGWIRSMIFIDNYTKIVSASDDETIKIWDIGSGKCLKTLTGVLRTLKRIIIAEQL